MLDLPLFIPRSLAEVSLVLLRMLGAAGFGIAVVCFCLKVRLCGP
jgi:hypothetical protein